MKLNYNIDYQKPDDFISLNKVYDLGQVQTTVDDLLTTAEITITNYHIPILLIKDIVGNDNYYLLPDLHFEKGNPFKRNDILILETDLIAISGGGGGSQDFQSVTDIGISTTNSFYKKVSDEDETIKSGVFEAEGAEEGIQFMGHRSILAGGMYVFGMALGEIGSLVHSNTDPLTPYINSFQLPIKANGTYTLATLEDIYAVGALIPTYADNAAAITGGLAINKIYKTATGEIRVRV